ncbi:MAG: hypothetical protein ABJQ41_00250, partial [Marinomonas sp.]
MRISRFGLSAGLSLALAACSGSYGVEESASAQQLGEVTLVEPAARAPSELQVLFWNDEQRNARFRDMESW